MCFDFVVLIWGKFSLEGVWALSSAIFCRVCPSVRAPSFQIRQWDALPNPCSPHHLGSLARRVLPGIWFKNLQGSPLQVHLWPPSTSWDQRRESRGKMALLPAGSSVRRLLWSALCCPASWETAFQEASDPTSMAGGEISSQTWF